MRVLSAIFLTAILTLPAAAQNEDAGWTFYGRFQGSSSPSGVVLKADPSIGYAFNQQFETYVGLPVYFVDRSDSISAVDGFVNGIGNAYLGFTGRVDSPAVRYSSNLLLTAPTGDQDRGFSTGRVTVDWTNTFSRDFDRFTPFASIGLANTVSDTAFFVRPFSSHGLVTHFDGGTLVSLVPALSVGASVYAVRGSGEQRIVSRVRQQDSTTTRRRPFEEATEIVGASELANDHGVSTWLSLQPGRNVDFQLGYNRSIGYDLNSVFFGIGFQLR